MVSDNTKRLSINKPRLFTPTVINHIREGSSGDVFYEKSDSSNFIDTALGSSGSFKYNQPGTGLVSTQQLNIDWSDFSNHTFFNSAQVKTNVAFNKIINEYPFDGTKGETEIFLDKLTGFEKWVFDQFPKNKGFLTFSGSNSNGEDGTIVVVKDIAGAAYPTLSKKVDAAAILDPQTKSMTTEMWLYIPEHSGSRYEWILNKTSGSAGFGVYNWTVSGSSTVGFAVSSGSLNDSVSVPVTNNTWTHLCWVWNRNPGVNNISVYKNAEFYTASLKSNEFGDLGTTGANLYIGSGSNFGIWGNAGGVSTVQYKTFSGSIDELRIWHNCRSAEQIKESQKKPVYAQNTLKLYFKFNEPADTNSSIVLDHSNNSIHGKINDRGIVLGTREMLSSSLAGDCPMIYEKLDNCPILFPSYPDNVTLKTNLLTSASNYDSQNPSLITNLVPKHLLLNGQYKDSLSTEEGDIISNLDSDATEPGEDKLGGTQVLLSLLYTWAKFFDELKLYIQTFSTLNKVDYNNFDTIPDEFLNMMANQEGIDLPPLFVGTSISQYIDGENLTSQVSTNSQTLQYIQNQIWRRILINMPDVIKSKGTIHSIKSFIRASGIDPDNVFRIREYGGPVRSSLVHARETKTDFSTMLNFVSGGVVTSPFLKTNNRTEPGYPWYSESVPGYTMLTSGSWTFEGTYKFDRNNIIFPQSLVRFVTSGSDSSVSGTLISNLVVTSQSNGCAITLHARPNLQQTPSLTDYISLPITGVDLFDGQKWYISFGRTRSDDPETIQNNITNISGSYFLRIAQQSNGEITEIYTTSSNYKSNNDIFETSSSINSNGIKFELGTSATNTTTIVSSSLLNDPNLSSSVRTSEYYGKVTQIRFWSKYLTDLEWKEHVKNYKSVGVQNPKKNWNFSNTVSGSWERLRIDASTDQIYNETNSSGEIILTDFTQNNFHLTGSGFPITSSMLQPERFEYSFISPKIDEGISTNKVRIRSFLDENKLEDNPWAQIAPVHETDHSLRPKDSVKLSIDFSIVDALDQDIMTIFSSLDEMNNYIGRPELMFAEGYKDLDTLREIYFNKLEDKINLRGFFEFYKWFDSNIGIFISQLVPRKTKFLGTNFIIESTILERSKVQYKFEDHWLGDDIRSGLKPVLLLQLLSGHFNRI